MDIKENIAYITCSCGDKFQSIKTNYTYDEQDTVVSSYEDWDEQLTAELYYNHLDKIAH